MIGVAWRSDGLLTLLWLRILFFWTSGQRMSWPPRGFVGGAFLSSAATARPVCKLLSTRLRRYPSTRDVPPWRLTCEWEIGPPP